MTSKDPQPATATAAEEKMNSLRVNSIGGYYNIILARSCIRQTRNRRNTPQSADLQPDA